MVLKFVNGELANRASINKKLFRVSPRIFERDSKWAGYSAKKFVTFETGHNRHKKEQAYLWLMECHARRSRQCPLLSSGPQA